MRALMPRMTESSSSLRRTIGAFDSLAWYDARMYMGKTRMKKAQSVHVGDGVRFWDQDWRVHHVEGDEHGNVKLEVHGDEMATRRRRITVIRWSGQQLETF